MLSTVGAPSGHQLPSWSSWASSTSTCTSSCSWHSACNVSGLDDHHHQQQQQHTQSWANPGTTAWPGGCGTSYQDQDTPWSLPLEIQGTSARDWTNLPHSPRLPPSSVASGTSTMVRSARARRPSVVAALLSLPQCHSYQLHDLPQCHNLPRSASAPPVRSTHSIDAGAFYRYYDGSVLGPGATCCPQAAPSGSNSAGGGDGDSGGRMCGGLVGGPLSSLAVAVPTKLEGLLKLFAHSLHLVLAAMCTRSE